jgi:hypothetical protein
MSPDEIAARRIAEGRFQIVDSRAATARLLQESENPKSTV